MFSDKKATSLSVAFFCVVLLLSYIRIFFGAELSDEAQYVASAYLPVVGGKPFFNELFLQQTASLLYSPFVYFYTKILGSTFGLVLFVRHLFFLLLLASTFVCYKYFCLKISRAESLLVSSLLLAFIPHSLPSLSYNTVGYLFCGIALFGFLLASECKSNKWALLAGVSAVVSIFAYPTLIVGLTSFFFITSFLVWKNSRRQILASLVGVAICSGVLLALLTFWGWENVLNSYHFSKLFGTLGGLGKFVIAKNVVLEFFPQTEILLIVFLLWIAALFMKPLSVVSGALALVVLFIFYHVKNAPPATHVLLPLLSIGYAFVAVKYKSTAAHMALAVALAISQLVLCWTSSMTAYSMGLSAVYLVMLLFVDLFTYEIRSKKLIVTVKVALVSFSLWCYYDYQYRDFSFSHMNARVETGPYAGLFTGERRKNFLALLEEDLSSVSADRKTIFFFDAFPAGYLFTSLKPETRVLFIHPANLNQVMRPIIASHFQAGGAYPDIVVHFKKLELSEKDTMTLDFTPQGFNDLILNTLADSQKYKIAVERDQYRLLLRQ